MVDIGYDNYKYLKEKYKPGTRIQLIEMKDPYPVPPGTIGTVNKVTTLGMLNMTWENGSTLGLCIGVDNFKIIRGE